VRSYCFSRDANQLFTAGVVPGVADGGAVADADAAGDDMDMVVVFVAMAIDHILAVLEAHAVDVVGGDGVPALGVELFVFGQGQGGVVNGFGELGIEGAGHAEFGGEGAGGLPDHVAADELGLFFVMQVVEDAAKGLTFDLFADHARWGDRRRSLQGVQGRSLLNALG
jgi:hypothetical protein